MSDHVIVGDFTALAVDDDLLFLDTLEAMLKGLGVRKILRADSGVNAFNALAALTSRIDCIICDLRMPNGNGLQLLKAVRLGRFKLVRPDACFIILSAIAHPLAVRTAAQLDVSFYLTKPVTPDGLKSGIAKARAKAFPLDFAKYARTPVPESVSAA